MLVNWTGHINNQSSSDMSAATLIRRRISGQSICACTFEARESVQGERRCGRSPRGVALSRRGVGEIAISSREQRGRGVPQRCAITAALTRAQIAKGHCQCAETRKENKTKEQNKHTIV